jgi:hypothetical protein
VDDKEPFLSRWSRRKLEAKENSPAVPPEQPAAVPAALPEPGDEPRAPESPQARSAEYREFFDPQVDEKLRQTALKGLFRDPHFNVMDGLDTYIDDYSLADPIPDAMLRQLNQAKELFLFDEEKTATGAAGGAVEAGDAAATAALDAGDEAAIPVSPPASAPDAGADVATGAVAAAPAQDAGKG